MISIYGDYGTFEEYAIKANEIRKIIIMKKLKPMWDILKKDREFFNEANMHNGMYLKEVLESSSNSKYDGFSMIDRYNDLNA